MLQYIKIYKQKGVQMQNAVRKNFAFEPMVAQHLEEIAADMNTSLTKALQELIEKRYEDIERAKKLEAAKKAAGSLSGIFGDMSIQEIKANMYV